MSRCKWLIVLAALCWASAVSAELPVRQSWQCQAGEIMVVSNTPCQDGAQPVGPATAVIYHCQHNGVSSFQQRPCERDDASVHLYRDSRSAATIASGEQVRNATLARAKAARAAQLARETGGGITVIGQQPAAKRTRGDGNADGYRTPNRSSSGGSF